MKIIVFIIKISVAALIIGYSLYCKHYYTVLIMPAFWLLALFFYMLPDSITDDKDGWIIYFIGIGYIAFITTAIKLDTGLRAINDGHQIRLVTAFHPFGKCLENGYRVDTLRHIPRCYEKDVEYSVKHEEMYMLMGEKYNTLFSKTEIIARGTDFVFRDEEYGHGKLHVCSFTDTLGVKHNIDMYGNDIHERGYSPKVIEYRDDDYIENV